MTDAVAVLNQVEKSYQMDAVKVPVLKGIDLLIRPGNFTVVLGPSGSGKTTMLNLIGCIDRPDRGSVQVAGVDVGGLSDDQLSDFRAANIGFIFQSFNLIPVLTAFENVEYPLVLAGMPVERRRRRVGKLLDLVGLSDRARNVPGQLSGGQRQRVAIARALARKPKLVMADEPTANLDSETGASILALMRQMQVQYKISFIFSSHDRSVINAADDLIVLRDGEIRSIQRKAAAAGSSEFATQDRAEVRPDQIMKTWSLAIRNLLRNRRRSLATLLALAVGSASILIFGGYTTNVSYSMTTAYVRAGGHLQVQYRDFFYYGSGNPAAYGIARYESILDAIRKDESIRKLVTVATPMLQFGGIAGNYAAGVSRTVVGSGYVAADVNKMRLWNEFTLRDKRPYFVLEGATPDAAIVGLGVARVLLLCEPLGVEDCPRPSAAAAPESSRALPADIAALSQLEAPATPGAKAGGKARIELLAGNARGAPNVATLSVVAAESQGFKELDELAVILQLEQAQQLVYGRTAPRATAILVQLAHTASMPEAQDRISALLANIPSDKPLTVQSFETLNPFYVQSRQLLDTIFGFIFVLIGGIVLFTVGNTMNAAVVERTVEIGTLRAIGLRQAGIRRLFLAEGFLLGCLGAALGVLTALLAAVGFNGLNLTWIPPGTSELVPLGLQVWGQTRMIIGTTLGLITIAVASAWLPAYRAAGLKIVEALRHA